MLPLNLELPQPASIVSYIKDINMAESVHYLIL